MITDCLKRNLLLIVASALLTTAVSAQTKIGWAGISITPDKPTFLAGQFHARISEGVWDPSTATAMALQSANGQATILVSCDLVSIEDELREAVYRRLRTSLPELDVRHVAMNATHTHSAPYAAVAPLEQLYGLTVDDLGKEVMTPDEYLEFAADRIAQVCKQAWDNLRESGISYGLGHAVVGYNRLMVYRDGTARMYGPVDQKEFSHVEGYEDHSLNLLYTWDRSGKLTGVIVNIACPSQSNEQSYHLTADIWCNVRENLRKALGADIHILAQTAAAGDQSPHVNIEKRADERMQKILGFEADGTGRGSIGRRKMLAKRISDEVLHIHSYLKDHIEWNPELRVKSETLSLQRRLISEEDVRLASEEAARYDTAYRQSLNKMRNDPSFKKNPRWYTEVTSNYRRANRGELTRERFALQKTDPLITFDIHVIRLGDIVFATNPFELYLDYGIRMKARSAAMQTFIVQLTGSKGAYLPTPRSVKGNAYGAVPASTLAGPEGGDTLVEHTLSLINSLFTN